MCGIVGYVGENSCKSFILKALTRLKYRGYDSAGFVCFDEKTHQLACHKAVGGATALKELCEAVDVDGSIGLGHTRWATHGEVNERNCHPQFDCQRHVAVVHNGVLGNYRAVKGRQEIEGHLFSSQTDTEVAAHLMEEALKKFPNSLQQAILSMLPHIKGGAYSFAFLLLSHSESLILVRYKSPLIIGLGAKEMLVASDPIAFSGYASFMVPMPDSTFSILKKDKVELYDFQGKEIPIPFEKVPEVYESSFLEKESYEHFMIKEIYEQRKVIENTVSFYASLHDNKFRKDNIGAGLCLAEDEIEQVESIDFIAAGSSLHASLIGQTYFQTIARIPSIPYLASEFIHSPHLLTPGKRIAICVSQSGETADTLEALRKCNQYSIPTVALTNIVSSSMVREATGFFLMRAGYEVSVASTKAFSCQIASLYLLAHYFALKRRVISAEEALQAEESLLVLAEVLDAAIKRYETEIISQDAQMYSRYEKFIFLGRHITYPLAMEAALKLKEISYLFAQSYPTGELKHGPLALVDETVPVVVFSLQDEEMYKKMLSNVYEVKARSGHIIAFAFEGQDELISLAHRVFILPSVPALLEPLAIIGIVQLWVYHLSKALGRSIDMPRNLAKSVTVE